MMNLKPAQAEKARTASGWSYDDTGFVPAPPSTDGRISKVAADDLELRPFSDAEPFTYTAQANPKNLNARVISQSREGLEEQLDTLMAHYDNNGLEREETAILHPYGILGQISEDHPAFASALLKHRLQELKADAATWWSSANREHANQQLALMDQLLAAGQYEELLALLVKLEKANKKVSFCQVMNAKFLDPDHHKETPLYKPFKNSAWFASLRANVLADLQKSDAREEASSAFHRLQQSFEQLEHRKADKVHSPEDLTDYMLLADPEAVNGYLKGQCDFRLRELRLKMKETGQALTNDERAEVRALSSQLQQLGKVTNRADLTTFLKDPANAELKKALESVLIEVYLQQLQQVIFNTDYAMLNKAGLHELVKTSNLFKEMMATYKTAQVLGDEELEALAKLETAVENFDRAEELYRLIDSEKHKPVDKRLFALKVPSVQRLMEKLTRNNSDTETQLYNTMEALFKAEVAFDSDRTHPNLMALQKARFESRRLQQEQAEFEIRAKLKDQDDLVVLTTGNYDTDIKTFKAIHAGRQKFTPVYPAGSLMQGAFRLAKRIIWDNERPFHQILADLEQAKVLKKLNYSASSEFRQLLSDVAGMDGASLEKAAASIAAPTSKLWKDWQAGKAGFLQVMNLPGQSYKALEQEARDIISSALEVAERNPAQFRQLFGDVSLIMDQLQSLLGPDSVGLLTQLQNAARAHSIASCFAGDEPVMEAVDPNSDLAKNIKRFQLLCDMAAYTMHATTAANFVKNVMTGNAAGFCGTAAGIVGGLLTFGAAAPACAAIGTALGTALTIGNAAVKYAGTHAIRNGLNSLDGEQAQLLDKVVNYGPSFLTATSPYDVLATGMRHFGKGDSVATAAARTILGPILTPFKNMYKAIKGIHQGEEGAWKQFGIELAVATSAIALTAALGATVYAIGFATILGSPALGAALTALTFSYGFFQLVSRIRTIGGSVYNSIQHYQQAMFNSDNPLIKKVKKECKKEARSLVARMMDRDLYYQRIQEEKMKELYNTYWKRWSKKHSAEALTHVQAVASQLKETEGARKELAKQVMDSVELLSTLDTAIKNAAEVAGSEEQFQALKTELMKAGIESDRINRRALALTLQTLKEEQLAIVERQCGTKAPGETEAAILATLNEHYRSIMLGGKVTDLLKLTPKQEQKAEDKAQKRVVKTAEASAQKHYEERAQLMLTASLTKAAEAQLEEGTEITEDAMKNPAVANAARAELLNQKQLYKDTSDSQMERYRGWFSRVSGLSGEMVNKLLGYTSLGLAIN
ncbi:hypothetical protein GZ77_01035 [Endozoicomonas montiporae]|uniref:Uncharacterized protein n=2 Tax=Endozoicomonas montiporae TaxID=1027273 RepID=A0A081NA09_9GAMM|nr:hypothetical protein [Endozoicomonas montiporae]AMO57044.1 hypothetical protein EZMO1_3009 [Endozoicomonas montiporae CL-33]KEQ15282.1 hypothetical protein GZ77_01035 [Endozoicomonas montiporae]